MHLSSGNLGGKEEAHSNATNQLRIFTIRQQSVGVDLLPLASQLDVKFLLFEAFN